MGTKLRFWHVPLLGVVSAITVLTLALLHPLLASTPFVAFSAGPKALFDAGLFSFLTSSAGVLTFFVITPLLFGVAYLQRCLIFLNEDEQCLLEGLMTKHANSVAKNERNLIASGIVLRYGWPVKKQTQ